MTLMEIISMPKTRWVVGSNMPGYMPDNDPAECTNWKDARDIFLADLQSETERIAEICDDPDLVRNAEAEAMRAARYVKRKGKARECSCQIGAYIYWLHKL